MVPDTRSATYKTSVDEEAADAVAASAAHKVAEAKNRETLDMEFSWEGCDSGDQMSLRQGTLCHTDFSLAVGQAANVLPLRRKSPPMRRILPKRQEIA